MVPHRDKIPKELPPDAKAWWPVLVEELEARGSLTRVARHRLSIYCQLFAQYNRATEAINRDGQTYVVEKAVSLDEDTGEAQIEIVERGITPEALQQAKLVKLLKEFDKEFGLLEAVEDPNSVEALVRKLNARVGQTAQANGRRN